MPTVIPNGGSDDITGAELLGYAGATALGWASGPQTPVVPGTGPQTNVEVQIASRVEEKMDALVQGWVDSGGPGGHQQAVAREILRRAALLQGDLGRSVRQWAKPGRERALMEMFAVMTKALVERDRLLLELRERLNQSPY